MKIITRKSWGVHTAYHLTTNATDWNLEELISAVPAFSIAGSGGQAHDTAL